MNSLAEQQQALLDALFCQPYADDTSPDPWLRGARGLQVYRSNGHAQAERGLLAAYPVLAELLGRESFDLLARDFWHHHPPVRGDLAQWGELLPTFLLGNPQLGGEPYLADVARVEWALHQAGLAADHTPAPATFALMATAAPEHLSLLLSSGVAIVASPYPVASIVSAHVDAEPALEEAGRLLRAGVAETARVWRQGFRPRVGSVSADEAVFLLALLAGDSLGRSLDHVPAFAFDRWLPRAVTEGLVLGAALRAA